LTPVLATIPIIPHIFGSSACEIRNPSIGILFEG
jgi:hypothetical protein